MQSSIVMTPNERKDLIVKMKRERRPSRRLRMHIVVCGTIYRAPLGACVLSSKSLLKTLKAW